MDTPAGQTTVGFDVCVGFGAADEQSASRALGSWGRYVETKPDYQLMEETLVQKLSHAGADAAALLPWAEGVASINGAQVTLLRRVWTGN